MSTECVIVAVDESGPGGDESVEVTARHRADGGIDILSVRELPQDEQHVKSPPRADRLRFVGQADKERICEVK